ncbi:MAG TPA: hypothetical protein VK666_13605 [Chryseolinea sp.]|nr:hypothetical protein [Chryseolinea sp.]
MESASWFTNKGQCPDITNAFYTKDVVASYALALRNDGYIDAHEKYLCSGEVVDLLWQVETDSSTTRFRNVMMPGKNFLINELTQDMKIINIYMGSLLQFH